MSPWLRVVEAWAVQQLLRTPAFHRAVEKVAKGVHRVRHGAPPEEAGGTKLDHPDQPNFINHFYDEVKTQLGAAEREAAKDRERALGAGRSENPVVEGEGSDAAWQRARARSKRQESTAPAEDEGSDTAWQNTQKGVSPPSKPGFLGEYMEALREQMRKGKNGR